MGDILVGVLVGVLEFSLSIAALTVYGTPERPKPIFLRALVRVVAFGGAIAASLSLAGLVDLAWIPRVALLPWFLCAMIVLLAEYDLGDRWIAISAWASALLIVGLMLL